MPGDLSNSGLVNLGAMENLKYLAYEIPLYLLMAVIGGLLGALFNQLNFLLTMFRHKYGYLDRALQHNLCCLIYYRHITRKWARVAEVVLIAGVTAAVGFLLIYFTDDCQMVRDAAPQRTVQVYRSVWVVASSGNELEWVADAVYGWRVLVDSHDAVSNIRTQREKFVS